jgi:hypothetical protein
MNVYTNTTFSGIEPIGNTSAIVIADDSVHAAYLLNHELYIKGIKQSQLIKPSDMVLVDTNKQSCTILTDGNY